VLIFLFQQHLDFIEDRFDDITAIGELLAWLAFACLVISTIAMILAIVVFFRAAQSRWPALSAMVISAIPLAFIIERL
jgi:hypothetical protein